MQPRAVSMRGLEAYMDGEGDVVRLHAVAVSIVSPFVFVLHVVVEEEGEIIDGIRS